MPKFSIDINNIALGSIPKQPSLASSKPQAGKLISLNPDLSPTDHFESNKEELGMIPDGCGLQLVFAINGENYLLAGPRNKAVITVNGGRIENNQGSYFNQLAEELAEESFGLLSLVKNKKGGYHLFIKGDERPHPLNFQVDKTFQNLVPGRYIYITFTAVCNTLTVKELVDLAESMTPTAKFWNSIGNFLYEQTKNFRKGSDFTTYWQNNSKSRSDFINQTLENYKQLTETKPLLIDPKEVFEVACIEAALNQLNEIKDFSELNKLFKHTVGRYSERPSYNVFKVSALLRSLNLGPVLDIQGNRVADKLFNRDVVEQVLPKLSVLTPIPADINLALTTSENLKGVYVPLKQQTTITLKAEPSQKDKKAPLIKTPISMMVLGAFITAIGIAAVAIAFTLLNPVSSGILLGVGLATILGGIGLFAAGAYKNRQTKVTDVLDPGLNFAI